MLALRVSRGAKAGEPAEFIIASASRRFLLLGVAFWLRVTLVAGLRCRVLQMGVMGRISCPCALRVRAAPLRLLAPSTSPNAIAALDCRNISSGPSRRMPHNCQAFRARCCFRSVAAEASCSGYGGLKSHFPLRPLRIDLAGRCGGCGHQMRL
jgi:hypothetical protein